MNEKYKTSGVAFIKEKGMFEEFEIWRKQKLKDYNKMNQKRWVNKNKERYLQIVKKCREKKVAPLSN